MSKICPNCLRPVRTGVNYCGYCGTSLVPTPQDPAPTIRSAGKESVQAKPGKPAKVKRVPKSGPPSKSWLKVPITLLVLVILAALAIRYWPEIWAFLSMALPGLKLS